MFDFDELGLVCLIVFVWLSVFGFIVWDVGVYWDVVWVMFDWLVGGMYVEIGVCLLFE